MQRLKILAAVAFAMPLAGCSQPIERFGVDGAEGEYCPPANMVPADIAWVPDDSESTPRGFTIRGCAKRPADRAAECGRLGQIISADIAPRDNANFFGWKDFKNSASAILFAKDDRTRYQFHGDQLVIKNPHIMDEWLILSARGRLGGQTSARPKDDDVVVAMCFAIEDFPRASRASTGRNYGCYRHAIGPNYSLDYRFVTDSEIPGAEELSKLDSNIISQVEAWRCPVN